MGNAAVEPVRDEDPYSIPQVLDRPVKMEERKKPTNLQVTTEPNTLNNTATNVQSRRGSVQTMSVASSKHEYDDFGSEDNDDLNLVEVIQQLIPYYGQGNSSNDSNLRAALSGLTTEDIDSKDLYGNTLLILACCYRCEDLVRIMLNKGADPNAVNNSGSCCLHFACHKDSSSLVIAKSLLSHGANPDVHEMQYGCTPLHYCATAGNIEFCKLLISKGAQVSSVDYYNMTCVDYARDSGNVELVAYLNQRLQQHGASPAVGRNGRNNYFFNGSAGGGGRGGGGAGGQAFKEWNMYFDPASGCNYYVHSTTGEAVWESEFASRLEAIRLQGNNSSTDQKSLASPLPVRKLDSASPTPTNEKEKYEVIKKCLTEFLQKYDASSISLADELLEKHKGSEHVLLKELCTKYNANENEEMNKFKSQLREFASAGTSSNANIGDRNPSIVFAPTTRVLGNAPMNQTGASPRLDPMQLQNALAEERIKFEAILAQERQKYDTQIAQERNKYTNLISEKDAIISSLESKGHSAVREKQSFDDEITSLKAALHRAQMQGGEAMVERENEIQRLISEVDKLKDKISQLEDELSMKENKLLSLENTLSGLTTGNEERIAKDREAAEERERVQREIATKHQTEIKALEEARRGVESKARADLAKVAADLKMQENESKEAYEELKKSKDSQIEVLQNQFAEERSNLTRKVTAVAMELEHSKKETVEAVQRMKAAEELQASMRDEIVEAKATIQLNIQLHKDLTREQQARKRLHNEMEDMKGKIRVYIRVRPMSKKEIERGCVEAVNKDGKLSVTVRGINNKADEKKTFDFDQVFGGAENNTQTDVFRDTKHLIMSVLDGYNVCIFAYGQTGAGKSFTMIGGTDIGSSLLENGDFDPSSGVMPRAVVELFRLLNERNAQITYVVEVQMFQLYRDNIDDLLAEKKKKDDSGGALKITLAEFSDTGLVQVQGAAILTASTPQEVMKIFAKGSSRRATAATQMNMESSRSHLICCLVVKMENRRTKVMSLGKLTLVDLAGSERVDKSGAEGDMLKEAQSINKSLSALGDVISALTSNQQHVPYRNHPLTMLMSDTLGGNAKTLIFINTSPADYNVSETVSSLNFGTRCKDITNSVSSGPGVQLAQVNALKKELNKLKKGGKGPPPPGA